VTPDAPVAPPRPVELTRHGDVRVDPYYWLRDRDNPEVIAYLEAENAYTERVLGPSAALRDEIFEEIRNRVQETDVSPPARKGPWEYFTRTFEGSQYAAHGRRPAGAPEGTDETVLLDENDLAAGLDYFSLGGLALSPDQTRLAYSFDDDGGELHSLRFRDIATGADLPDVMSRFSRVLVPEINLGQLVKLIRADYLVDAIGMNQVQGRPFKVSEVIGRCLKLLNGAREEAA